MKYNLSSDNVPFNLKYSRQKEMSLYMYYPDS